MRKRVVVKIRACLLVGLSFFLGLVAAPAVAGGGPETTLLIVNARSPLSLYMANEYIRLRDLPARQVVWLEDVPHGHTINVERFRQSVLAPIRAHMDEQGLTGEIDLIAYSAGFPYAVNFRRDERAHGLETNRHRGNAGSLTGMTFFADQVEAGRVDYFRGNANPYFRRPIVARSGEGRAERLMRFEVTRGFRSANNWSRNPTVVGPEYEGFFLSALLGYTGFRGNSVPEILDYLERAAGADASHPDGTVYLMENSDIRTRTRRPMFAPLQAAMEARGRKVEVLTQNSGGENGRLPQGRADVLGVVAGTRTFDWEASGSRMLPGAIAESFTSYGGHFEHPAQTKLSEFLRSGAAGSSGAVREPYSFMQKFPLPLLHAYYADGASLAEAFFQSTSSPYQLLVVGDPLTRPFAHFADVALQAPDASQAWRGTVEITANVQPVAGRAVRRVELWVDGRRHASAETGAPLTLDTTVLPDGANEIRLVAVEDSAIETRSYVRQWVQVDNRARSVVVEEAPGSRVALDQRVTLSGRADGARQVRIFQGTRELARETVADGRWRVSLPADKLGMGPVALQVEAEWRDAAKARSLPVAIDVAEPALLPAMRGAPDTAEGVSLQVPRVGGEFKRAYTEGLSGRMPREIRDGLNEIETSAYVQVKESGLYELTVQASASFEIGLGDTWRKRVGFRENSGDERFYVPLTAGWHRFQLALWNMNDDDVQVFMGGPEPTFRLSGDRVRQRVR